EGETDDPEVLACRARQQRNFLVTLFLSQGVPMLLGGDEFGRTQNGNNNAYCQDNEISWFRWDEADEELLEFTRQLIRLRHEHPVFRRKKWFEGIDIHGKGVSDIDWLTPEGEEMSHEDWQKGYARSVQIYLNGEAIPSLDQRGHEVTDDSFLALFNAHDEPIEFTAPTESWASEWLVVFDTMESVLRDESEREIIPAEGTRKVSGRAIVLLREVKGS
ncbi:MAG: hypothetical protein R3320_11305, partial [Nitriliruptorales bacterium]|nr:hypothetical protein [Nitriliruptorales bacterium]